MKKVSIRNPLLLLTTAVVWGVAFVAQSVGMDYVGAVHVQFCTVHSGCAGADTMHVFAVK